MGLGGLRAGFLPPCLCLSVSFSSSLMPSSLYDDRQCIQVTQDYYSRLWEKPELHRALLVTYLGFVLRVNFWWCSSQMCFQGSNPDGQVQGQHHRNYPISLVPPVLEVLHFTTEMPGSSHYLVVSLINTHGSLGGHTLP